MESVLTGGFTKGLLATGKKTIICLVDNNWREQRKGFV